MSFCDNRKIVYVAPTSAEINLTHPDAIHTIAALTKDNDTIIFLPAYTPEKGDASELTIKNILMVHHVLSGIKDRAIAQFIYVSSDAVYPMTADIIDEKTPACPYDLYGQMHRMREQYAQKHIPAEKLTILRPCAIYGKDDTHNSYSINRFIRTGLAQSEISLFGEGEEYRDHIYVDDFVQIILAACDQHVTGIFNVATGEAWRFGDIARCIKNLSGKNIQITCKARAVPITHRHFNVAKLARTFPKQPLRGIEEGIRSFLACMA